MQMKNPTNKMQNKTIKTIPQTGSLPPPPPTPPPAPPRLHPRYAERPYVPLDRPRLQPLLTPSPLSKPISGQFCHGTQTLQ